jgi:hypothetical protein
VEAIPEGVVRKTQRKARTKVRQTKKQAAYARQQAKLIEALPNPAATHLLRSLTSAAEAAGGALGPGLGSAAAMMLGSLLGNRSITVEVEGGDPIVIRPVDVQAVAMQKFASYAATLMPASLDMSDPNFNGQPSLRFDGGIRITQPISGCDGSGWYAYDGKKDNCRGARLKKKCLGCRACC